ncbi:hypothetical protein ACUDTL_16905 [Stenotrophomonas pavanii]|uniref:hypothetical protein n=1 Tax=Stenotrophomonas pavanii TaxID=487698 RepID=UPI004041CFC1
MHRELNISISYATETYNLPYALEEGKVFPLIWLSREPDRISEIPELEGEPELASFLAAINAPGLPFESFRCALEDVSHPEVGGVLRRMYVGVIFRDREWASDISNYFMLARGLLLTSVHNDSFPDGSSPFELRLMKNCLKDEGGRIAFTADVQMEIWGEAAEEMREHLIERLAALQHVLSYA